MALRPFPAAIVAALFATLLGSTASAQTELRWKLTSGQVLNQSLTQDAETSMNLGGQMITTKMTIAMNTIWTVNGVDNQGIADITQSFAGIKFKMNSPAFNLDYDSTSGTEPADPVGKQIANSVKPLLQTKFNLKLSPRGEITEVKIPEESQKLLQQVQTGPQGGPLSQDAMIAMIKESVIPFPAMQVQKGATWQHKSEVKAPPLGSMTNESVLTYEGTVMVEGQPLEQIKVATKSKLTAGEGNPQVQISVKDQTEDGTIFFDNAAGRLSHSESTQNLVMEIMAAGQKFEQTMKTVKKVKMTSAGG